MMALPPLQPVYVLRGHAAQVHALEFSPTNTYLLSGDAEGWIVAWNLTSKRATASWHAHTNAVLGVTWWTENIIVTHGRDSKIHMWKLEGQLDTVLPIDRIANPELPPGKAPTLFHSMTVNTLNFCSFTWTKYDTSANGSLSYLLALPHTLSSEAVDIFHVSIAQPGSESPIVDAIRKTTIPAPNAASTKTGLTMCLSFQKDWDLLVGYESGHSIVYTRESAKTVDKPSWTIEQIEEELRTMPWDYKPSYISKAHSQPVLSIQGAPHYELYVTSAADSKLATHRIPEIDSSFNFSAVEEIEPCHSLNTKHSGQQGLSIRDDGLLMATAGWDGRGRVYRSPVDKTASDDILAPKEIAVLKWHKEGCYSTAFAHVWQDGTGQQTLEALRQIDEEFGKDRAWLANSGPSTTETVAQRRERKAKKTHWLALGSKDGKISLWDIL